MTGKILKRIRVFISISFLVLFLFAFIDIKGIIPEWMLKNITFFQFIPSVISFLTSFSFLSIGFIIVLLLTFLFGRVYCSFLCPLGTFQDFFIYISRKIKRKKKNIFTVPYTKTRFSLLIIIFIPLILFNSVALIGIFDPYSIWGRIANNIFRTSLIFINNSVSSLLSYFDFYSLYPYEYQGISIPAFALASFSILLIIYFSVKRGRLYCNTVCPVGTLLGIIAKYSFFRFHISETLCKNCTLCERVCKAECINSKEMKIDMSRCVSCFNCITVCSSDGVVFERTYFKKKQTSKISNEVKEDSIDVSKRDFFAKVFISLTALSAFSFIQKIPVIKKLSTVKEKRYIPIAPPGAKSIEKFNLTCTACNLCVKVCPTQVIQPSFLEYGVINMFQPRMDYLRSFCNFECNSCTQVCPTGALEFLPLQTKKQLQIGKAKLIKENCIVFTEETECGACSEHCPTKAVNMVPYKGLAAPEINENYCIGCGACEKACPTKPYKSIYVLGNREHKIAQKNTSKKILKEFKVEEDFPF